MLHRAAPGFCPLARDAATLLDQLAVLMIPRRLIPESSMLSRTQRLALSQAYAPSLENDRILGQGNSARQNDAAC
jgi:hypothetical protein